MPVLCNFQPCELLDLAGLHRNASDVETQNLFQLNINQLRGVESPRHSIQGAHKCALGRIFLIEPVPFSAAGPVHPLEVPSLLANHRIENRRSDLFHQSPAIADRLSKRIQAIRQDAIDAQENRVWPHACALFDTLGTSARKEPGEWLVDPTMPGAECSVTKSALKLDRFALFVSDSAPEKPVASGWLSGAHKCIFVRNLRDRGFSASLLSTKLMASPFVRLLSRKMLVWSEAGNAEGEKEETCCCSKYTPAGACVPAAFIPTSPRQVTPQSSFSGLLRTIPRGIGACVQYAKPAPPPSPLWQAPQRPIRTRQRTKSRHCQ
jgi:hypothetical protein